MTTTLSEPLSAETQPSGALRRSALFLIPGLLPALLAIFPTVFYYANNVEILNISSLWRMLLLTGLTGLGVYLVYAAFNRRPYPAALAAAVFLVFFHTYGIVYDFLLPLNAVRVTHYNLLPLYVLLGVYVSLLALRIRPAPAKDAWRILTAAVAFLGALNLVRIAPNEIERASINLPAASAAPADSGGESAKYPDIYYLVFDEFAGFEAMRSYWKNTEDVDAFTAWLASQGFYVAENSHGQSINTIYEMARRLNYADFPAETASLNQGYMMIADNNAMRFLKAKGYTTIVFDEARSSIGHEAKPKIIADINFEDDPAISRKNDGTLFDEFGMLVADKTMLRAFSQYYDIRNKEERRHQTFIHFTTNKLGDLEDVSPKFIYAHVILPHMPFMFDENGGYVDPGYHRNWDYYEGTYIYSMKVARQMVANILADADPGNPPVIILQSDHGARNLSTQSASKLLANYPDEYKTSIMNAILAPNCPDAPFAPDMKPINTFPIVFNCVFDAEIPLLETLFTDEEQQEK